MTEGYSTMGDNGSTSWVGQLIGAWSAYEIEQEKTKQTQAKEFATPYQYNNPQAMAAPQQDKTMTYMVVGGFVLLSVFGLVFALKN